jgi:hypothetical protein
MLITDRIVYIELQKTGCSHTIKILSALNNKNCKIIGKHNTYDSIPKEDLGNFESKLKIGNIRNPWDWYVSLWAFGSQKRGGLHHKVTNQYKVKLPTKKRIKLFIRKKLGLLYPKLDDRIWIELYSDPKNLENFNSWLKLILSVGKHDIGEKYKTSKMASFAGLLTYRYAKLFTYNGKEEVKRIESPTALKAHDKRSNFLDIVIRNESLHDSILEHTGKMNQNHKQVKDVIAKFKERTNTSIRKLDYRKYYNDESINLVGKYEKFIIDKYGYSFY